MYRRAFKFFFIGINKDLVLINASDDVFSILIILFNIWHIQKNVLINYKNFFFLSKEKIG